jgi:DNA-binding NarL/FixJ family response regulator
MGHAREIPKAQRNQLQFGLGWGCVYFVDHPRLACDRAQQEHFDLIVVDAGWYRNPEDLSTDLYQLSQVSCESALVVYELPDRPELILECLAAGATTYVKQRCLGGDLVQTLELLKAGEIHLEPHITARMMQTIAGLSLFKHQNEMLPSSSSKISSLTARESEILNLIPTGISNAEIANRLYIEVGTVKNHVHNILKKLEVSNRQEASAAFLEAGRVP